MPVIKAETLPIKESADLVKTRQSVRTWASELGFSLVDQTKMVTAASELARNAYIHGRGGTLCWEIVERDARRGLKLRFADEGPGIPNMDLALTDGWTSGTGLGMGLSGARRLVNDFEIDSKVGAGTRVTITRWK